VQRRPLSALLLAFACGSPPNGADDAAVADAASAPVVDAATPDAEPDSGPDAAPGSPDLTLTKNRLLVDISIEEETFTADSCELDPTEACVGAPGLRRLLRFGVETPNIGTADLFLGPPSPSNPLYSWSECHEHYHFEGYAAYYLIDSEGAVVAPGHKQAFCLLDWHRVDMDDPTVADDSKYHCAYQGIQRGWSDVYAADLPCQFVDITGVPDGDYTLRVELNTERNLEELRYDNNVLDVPVTLGDADLQRPTEACPAGVDGLSADGKHRECGWDLLGTWDCEPGALFRIGCSAACSGLGECTGDPMVRVCNGADPDGNCSATTNIGDNDDSCGSKCPRVKNRTCPLSGKVDVYAAAIVHGADYTCDVQLEYQ